MNPPHHTRTTILQLLFSQFSSIDLHAIDDQEEVIYSGTAIDGRTGKRVSMVRADPDMLVLALANQEPTRRCGVCRKLKGMGEFAREHRSGSGRSFTCRICERKRVAKRKRATVAAARKTPAAKQSQPRKARKSEPS